jgi:hypothetical protein
MNKKNDNVDVSYSENLNLDMSSNDDSIKKIF